MRFKIFITILFVFVFTVAASAQRSLTVEAEAGATVWLDGIVRGTTDDAGKLMFKPVSRGTHTLRVRAHGFKQVTQPITPTQTTVSIKLVKTNDRAEIAFQNAEKMMSEDAYKAIDLYKESLRLSPKYAEAQLGLARAYASTGDYADGLAFIKKVRRTKPIFPELSAIEGRLFKSDGKIDDAIDSFERAIREGKGFQPEAHTGLALIFKDEAEAARSRGDFEDESDYYAESAKSFESAIAQLSATESVVYLFLGQIYENTNQKDKAIAVYKRFLKDLPDHEERTAVESFIEQLQKPSIL